MKKHFTCLHYRYIWLWALLSLLVLGTSCAKKDKESKKEPVKEFTEKDLKQTLASKRMTLDRGLTDISPAARLAALASLLHEIRVKEIETIMGVLIPGNHCVWGPDQVVLRRFGQDIARASVARIGEVFELHQNAFSSLSCEPLKEHLAETCFLMSSLAEKQWWPRAAQLLKTRACELGAERACGRSTLRSVVKPTPSLQKMEHRATDPHTGWVITELTRSHVSVDGKSILQTGGADPKTRCALVEKMTRRYADIAERERDEARESQQLPRDPVILTVVEGDVTSARACFYLAATLLAADTGWRQGDAPEESSGPVVAPKKEPAPIQAPVKKPAQVEKKIRPENASMAAMRGRGEEAPAKEEAVAEPPPKPMPVIPVAQSNDRFSRDLKRHARDLKVSIFTATSFEMGGGVRYIAAEDVHSKWCLGAIAQEAATLRETCAAQ